MMSLVIFFLPLFYFFFSRILFLNPVDNVSDELAGCELYFVSYILLNDFFAMMEIEKSWLDCRSLPRSLHFSVTLGYWSSVYCGQYLSRKHLENEKFGFPAPLPSRPTNFARNKRVLDVKLI